MTSTKLKKNTKIADSQAKKETGQGAKCVKCHKSIEKGESCKKNLATGEIMCHDCAEDVNNRISSGDLQEEKKILIDQGTIDFDDFLDIPPENEYEVSINIIHTEEDEPDEENFKDLF
nr:hypothetical protein [Candidatus Sigynarchaeota archaeon]